jgi:diacylglycerol kinase (ATP)
VANAPSYGSGIQIAPDARMDDGMLNVVVVGEVKWTQLFEAIPILLTSGDLRLQEVSRFQCPGVHIQSDRPALVHGDGELLGESPAEFEIVPQAVQVMTPKARPDREGLQD